MYMCNVVPLVWGLLSLAQSVNDVRLSLHVTLIFKWCILKKLSIEKQMLHPQVERQKKNSEWESVVYMYILPGDLLKVDSTDRSSIYGTSTKVKS